MGSGLHGNRQGDAPAGDAPGDDTITMLYGPGGEFRDAALETGFVAFQAGENLRHSRILLIASILFNTLFLASDWRFHGTPHFLVAVPARLFVIAAAVVSLALLHYRRDPAHRERVMIGWMAATALGVAALVSSRSDIALFVMSMLPIVYYLAVPVSFVRRMIAGAACSLAMIVGYESGAADHSMSLGLGLAMLALNVAMVLMVARANRLDRLEWLAARAERRAAAELAASREQIEKMFAAAPVPMIVTSRDTGRILRLNDAAVGFVGGGVHDATDLYVNAGDRQQLIARVNDTGFVRDHEVQMRRADGAARTVLISVAGLDLSAERLVISGFTDITDRKAAQRDLEWLATTDALTGLPNRLSFFAAGRAEMVRASRTGGPLALLMADLDNFKRINDEFGHQGGDEALRSFATICLGIVGERVIAARLGGEEFGFLLRDTDLAGATATAETLRETLSRHTIQTRRGTVGVTLSIGVAMVDPHDRDLDPALARADAALYAAKNGGRNRVHVASPPPARRPN